MPVYNPFRTFTGQKHSRTLYLRRTQAFRDAGALQRNFKMGCNKGSCSGFRVQGLGFRVKGVKGFSAGNKPQTCCSTLSTSRIFTCFPVLVPLETTVLAAVSDTCPQNDLKIFSLPFLVRVSYFGAPFPSVRPLKDKPHLHPKSLNRWRV